MKTTKHRRLNLEVLSVISLIIFATKTHMLDGTVEPIWWGYVELISFSILFIIAIESFAKFVNIIRQTKEEVKQEEEARKRRQKISYYICNPK